MYYGNKKFGKTQATRDWYQAVFDRIRHQPEDFKRLREYFNPSKHVYRVYIEVLVPETVFYTKNGSMTNKVVEISNLEKSIIDTLLLEKFFSESGNLQSDDRYLQYMESKKVPTERYWGINVKIEIVEKPKAEPA